MPGLSFITLSFILVAALSSNSQSECPYVTSWLGTRLAANVCETVGVNHQDHRIITCNTTHVILKRYIKKSNCSGVPSSTTDITASYKGPRKCGGVGCSYTTTHHKKADCSDSPFKTDTTAVSLHCQGKERTFCDANYYYRYLYNNNSCLASTATIYKYARNCVKIVNEPGYSKITDCVVSQPQPQSFEKTTGSYGFAFRHKSQKCTEPAAVHAFLPLQSCQNQTKQYCGVNRRAMWTYSFPTNGTSCSMSTMNGASYFSTECETSKLWLNNPTSNQTLSLICSGGPKPPVFDFGKRAFATLLLYNDSKCTKFVAGVYYVTNGTCSVGDYGDLRLFCKSKTEVRVVTFANNTKCSMNSTNTQIFDGNCKLMPSIRLDGKPLYTKVFSCGVGQVDPANAPGLARPTNPPAKGFFEGLIHNVATLIKNNLLYSILAGCGLVLVCALCCVVYCRSRSKKSERDADIRQLSGGL